jgi:hypothetical protein
VKIFKRICLEQGQAALDENEGKISEKDRNKDTKNNHQEKSREKSALASVN